MRAWYGGGAVDSKQINISRQDARTHKSLRGRVRARVELSALPGVPPVHLLLPVSMRLPQNLAMTSPPQPPPHTALPLLLLAAFALLQMSAACNNCVTLGKAEKAMFRAHSAACGAASGAEPAALAALLAGELRDSAALRAHVYCVLLKCKLIAKDGRLLKSALGGKLALRPGARNATKILEKCAEQSVAATPEDTAWNLFRCGYDKKAVLFEYMPVDKQPDDA